MAMTAWSAKVFRSAICPSVNGLTSVRRIPMTPMATPSRRSGVARMVLTLATPCQALRSGNSVSISAA